ncbi:protein kinase [Streptomyces sp. NPDC051561]|uniref:serine/threonine-protein kinase n=1 Tax=Streptomyces sp. NPDC051561 TaxID=3365658 RepID=UPI00379DC2C1
MPGFTSGGVQGLLIAGRYRLGETIGQGGMGRVWRAYDEILDRSVAVKEMRVDGLDAEDNRIRRERTLREARATARIDHPNVVRVYDVADEGERLWIVMELVDSRSLEQLLVENGPVSPREAARIGLGVTAALREVHARGVLHRDIKPGNVLLGRGNDRVVLTDFGIAAIQNTTALTIVGMLVGSPDYMAPERVGGRPQGAPSDLWSLGATLCAAVAGTSPFTRPTTMATLHAVLYEEPELPPEAAELTPLLAALLAKEPESRPTVDALYESLQALVSPARTPTLVEPVGPVGPEAGRDVGTSPEGTEAEAPTEAGAPGPEPTRGESPAGPAGEVSGEAAAIAPEPEPTPESEPEPEPEAEAHGPTVTGTPRRSGTAELRAPAGRPASPAEPDAAADPRAWPPAPEPEPEARAQVERSATVREPRPHPATEVRRGSVPEESKQEPPPEPPPEPPQEPVRESAPDSAAPDPVRADAAGPVPEAVPEPPASRRKRGRGVRFGRRGGARPPEDSVPEGYAATVVPTPVPLPTTPATSPQEETPEPSPDESSAAAPAPPRTPTEVSSPLPGATEPAPRTPQAPEVTGVAETPETPAASEAPEIPEAPEPVEESADPLGTSTSTSDTGTHIPDADAGVATAEPPLTVAGTTHPDLAADPPGTGTPGTGTPDTGTPATGIPAADPRTAEATSPEATSPEAAPPETFLHAPTPTPDTPHHRARARTRVLAVVAGGVGIAVVATIVVVLTQGADPGRKGSANTTLPPTVAGTARPPTTAVLPGSRNETGFAWVPPSGWTRSAKSPSNVHYHSPNGTQEIAASYSLARGGDLLKQWEQFEADSHDVLGYAKIRLERTTFQGRPAIIWEYYFTQSDRPWQARQIGFNAGGKSYQLNVWFEKTARDEAFGNYERVTDSFVAL